MWKVDSKNICYFGYKADKLAVICESTVWKMYDSRSFIQELPSTGSSRVHSFYFYLKTQNLRKLNLK
jgi:hypothetical protein